MSSWPRPTTADIALRAFASSPSRLFTEASLGMQDILLSDEAQRILNTHVRHSSLWQIEAPHDGGSQAWDLLLVQWLEEVLYRAEIHNQWLVDCQLAFSWEEKKVIASGHVSWVESEHVEREVEIKAVTSHELQFIELKVSEHAHSPWEQVPDFQGPGWFCDVVFDI
ncbi:archease [Euryarchaeota archaeon]|nr:archease [Euryarchaeota archaeon]MDA8843677.1 archease [Euryarchaeota archaeon]MDA9182839.1 archease [Candidatus Poseidoniaceae archaeon]MDC3236166.1 archease [Candidatus Poseidoniaceae archaeon]